MHDTGQVGKVLGERWKALNMKQREPYEAKAATDKKRYEDEKASYNNVRTSIFDAAEIFAAMELIVFPSRTPTMTKTRIKVPCFARGQRQGFKKRALLLMILSVFFRHCLW